MSDISRANSQYMPLKHGVRESAYLEKIIAKKTRILLQFVSFVTLLKRLLAPKSKLSVLYA